MVNGIEIEIKNGLNKKILALIHNEENVLYCNNKKYNISSEEIDKLLDILVTWKYEYGSDKTIDSEEYKITVYSNGKETTYHGKGIFPKNYNEFKMILEGIIYE